MVPEQSQAQRLTAGVVECVLAAPALVLPWTCLAGLSKPCPPTPSPTQGLSRSGISVGLRKEEWRARSTRTQGPDPK